jgi:hypothetical protein
MASSSTIYTIGSGDVGKTVYDLTFEGATANPPGYLDEDHIFMWLNDVLVTVGGGSAEYGGSGITFVFTTDTQLTVTGYAGVLDDKVEFRRTMPIDQPIIDFVDGAGLTESDLDKLALENLYRVHEIQDGFGTGISASVASVAEYAADAEAAAVSTAADLLLTNADVVSTNADVVSTNADAAATAADLVQTNLDQISCASDAADTAADLVLTNADVVLTHADVVSTNADVVTCAGHATDAETAQTAAETAQTAAELAETNAETAETNAEASAIAAGISETNAAVSEVNAAASAANLSNDNLFINGDFQVWQRGNYGSAVGYDCADRWRADTIGLTFTIWKQAFTAGQTDVPGNPTYYAQVGVTHAVGASNYMLFEQRVEHVTKHAGQTLTLSWWAQSVTASSDMAVEFIQVFGAGGSAPVTSLGVSKKTVTTSWAKYEATVTLPSISGKTVGTGSYLAVIIWMSAGSAYDARTDSLGLIPHSINFANFKLERGDTATELLPRPYGDELTLCQRYYESGTIQMIGSASAAGQWVGNTHAWSVTKRTTPTLALGTPSENNNLGTLQTSVYPSHIRMWATTTTGDNAYYTNSYSVDAEL